MPMNKYSLRAYLRVMWFKQSQLLVKLLLITIISHKDQIVKERAADYYLLRNFLLPKKSGGGERDRTDDPLLAKQVLSQLSYSPSGQNRLVGLDGLEPSTPRLSSVCSNQLSYRPEIKDSSL